jgi:hypothetical protein
MTVLNVLVNHCFGDCQVVTCRYVFDDLCTCNIPFFLRVLIDYCSAEGVRAPYIATDVTASVLHYDQ